MVIKLFKNEISLQKNKIISHIFTVLFPILMLVVGIPELFRVSETVMTKELSVFFLLIMIQFSPTIYGKDLAVNFLSDSDNDLIKSLRITPQGVDNYILVKIIFSFIYSIVGVTLTILAVYLFGSEYYNLSFLSITDVFILALLFSFITPIIGLFVLIFSKNKVDGNTMSIIGPILSLLPVLLIDDLFKEIIQYMFSILPNFAASKILLIEGVGHTTEYDLSIYLYVLLGVITNILITVFLLKVLKRKIYK